MGKRENAVVTACCKVLDIHGVPWARMNSGTAIVKRAGGKMAPMAFGKPGWPDIVAVLPDGRFLGVECKAPELPGLYTKKQAGKLSDLQRAVHQQLLKSNAAILTVQSSHEMEQDLNAMGYFNHEPGLSIPVTVESIATAAIIQKIRRSKKP